MVNRSTDTAALYVNGELIISKSITSIDSSNTTMRLDAWSTLYSDYWMGDMDEVRIWNIARSQTEIQADMYASLSSETGLVAYYQFDQDSGLEVIDTSNFNNNGVLNGGYGPTWLVSDALNTTSTRGGGYALGFG
ncbi:MAG: hypothetical protein QM487_13235 [Candidatus Marithrix sp.]